MKTKKIRPNDVAQNGSEKREKMLYELIEKAKEKGNIVSVPKR
jgi:hypothetical protein